MASPSSWKYPGVMDRSGSEIRSLALLAAGCPSISTVPCQLLPVRGTPHANAAFCTPGIAVTRSKARR
jgi:hypothetical protein